MEPVCAHGVYDLLEWIVDHIFCREKLKIVVPSLSPPSCLSSCVIRHMDSSARSGSDLQNLRDAAEGASAAVPKRASRPEPDAPNCRSGYVDVSYRETDIWHPANVTSPNVLSLSPAVCRLQVQTVSRRLAVVEESLLLLFGGAAGGSSVERERRVLPETQQQPGGDQRLCRDGNTTREALKLPYTPRSEMSRD